MRIGKMVDIAKCIGGREGGGWSVDTSVNLSVTYRLS